ncbi:sigma-54 interaction domain-containing protein [Halalkalibacter akibai]|uniref:Transcriptional regulator BkdR of isoleucine and valine catabolism operon n=1 Tax=Halalkalibacter akibai (strain ATCC 43226 / DSM 21942 / CIP 109018 / JCM 9157 / 1139) TaxID=1236973 RepID=W4QWX6_HALA3|nr:sigma-54-dependent Fis family transcriptional regulator [Halalkalibacter akibai]GAE36630.1 transcriptional regulator BkdR of isoleucine and valine catabolism operon [Halalkalibacter akibai JCM 9157]
MKQAIIIGAGQGGTALFHLLMNMEHIQVVAVYDIDPHAPGIQAARKQNIQTGQFWQTHDFEHINFVFEATGEPEVLMELRKSLAPKTMIVPSQLARLFYSLMEEKDQLIQQLNEQMLIQDTILNSTYDGMIAINEKEQILIFNEAAERISGINAKKAIGKSIIELLPTSGLPRLLKTKQVELHQRQEFENGTSVITTRVPMFEKGRFIGALAVFKDITEIEEMSNQVLNLKSIQTMLEAIIHSSNDAISVVDEKGNGLMINPAYTKLTGLEPEEVIGHPATADISEGESMHLQVLETGQAVRGVPLKVGPNMKDVIVNVAPIIVDGKKSGSVGVIHDVSELTFLHSQLEKAKKRIRTLEAKYSFDEIVGESDEMRVAKEQAKLAASTPATILLRGESGTGKELFAHAIHNGSPRSNHSFVRVNCAALSEQLLESELFGYEEGAFSGAKRGGKRGLFEEANNGSIFLDEIGELSSAMQAKLLRVLQEQEIIRVGGTKPIMINVRVIAATNVNLEKAIAEKEFREDLYYRLNKFPIYIPPLRERTIDLGLLSIHLLSKLNKDYGRYVQSISEEAINYLRSYHWPGNVRELENVLARTMIYMEPSTQRVEQFHLPSLNHIIEKGSAVPINSDVELQQEKPLQQIIDDYERNVLKKALARYEGSRTKTARALGISVRSLYYKMEKHQIE